MTSTTSGTARGVGAVAVDQLSPVLTQREVADVMTARGDRMSRARVSQIEAGAMAKLREALEQFEDWKP